jgi:tetratricopeptide (TPR) repeat protein
LSELAEAQSCAEEALELSLKVNNRQFEGQSQVLLGRILGKMDGSKREEAEGHIIKGIKILEELKLRPSLSQGYFCLGELYADAGRKNEALINLNKALSMCQEMGIGYWPDKIQEVLGRL